MVVARCHRNPVDEVLDLGGPSAVDSEISGPLRRPTHVGRQQDESERIAIVLWKLLNPLVVDDEAGLRVLCPQQRDLAGNGHTLGGGANLHDEVEPDAVSDL